MQEKNYGMKRSDIERLALDLSVSHQEEIPADYWHGYMTAIALSPVSRAENEWMPMVLGRQPGAETAELEEDVRKLLGGIIDAVREGSFAPLFPGDDISWESCNPSGWCEAFLTASHGWPEDLQEHAGEELVSLILPVVIFYNPAEYLEEHASHMSETEQEDMLAKAFAFFGPGLCEVPGLWAEVLEAVDGDQQG